MKIKERISILLSLSMIISGWVVKASEKNPFTQVDYSNLTTGFEYDTTYTADDMSAIYDNNIITYGSSGVYKLVKDENYGTALQIYPSAYNKGGSVIMTLPEAVTHGRLQVDINVKMIGTSSLIRHMLLPMTSTTSSRYTLAYLNAFRKNPSNTDSSSSTVHFQPEKDKNDYYQLSCVITSPDTSSNWIYEVYDKTNIEAGPFYTQEFVRTADDTSRYVATQFREFYLAGNWSNSTSTYGDGANGIELNKAVAYKCDVPKLVSVGDYDDVSKSITVTFDKDVSVTDAEALVTPDSSAILSNGITKKEVVVKFPNDVAGNTTHTVNLSGVRTADSDYGFSYEFSFYRYPSGSGLLKSVDYNTYEAKTYTNTALQEFDSSLSYVAKGTYEVCNTGNGQNGLKISNSAESKGGSLTISLGEQITSGRIQIDADVKMLNGDGSTGLKRNLFRPKGSGSPYTVYYQNSFVETSRYSNTSGEFSSNKPTGSDGFFRLSCIITAEDDTTDWTYELYDRDTSISEPFYTMTIPRAVNDTITEAVGVLSYIDSLIITDIWFETGNTAEDYIQLFNVNVYKTVQGEVSSVSEFDNVNNSVEIAFNTPIQIGENTKITVLDENSNEIFTEVSQTSSRKLMLSCPWGMSSSGIISVSCENVNYYQSDFGINADFDVTDVSQDERYISNVKFTDEDGNSVSNLDEISELNFTFDSTGVAGNTLCTGVYLGGRLEDVKFNTIANTDNNVNVTLNGADKVIFYVWNENIAPIFKSVSVSCTEDGESALLPLSIQGDFYTEGSDVAACIKGNDTLYAKARLVAGEAFEDLTAKVYLIRNSQTELIKSEAVSFTAGVADVSIALDVTEFVKDDVLRFVIADSEKEYFTKKINYDDPKYIIDILMVAGQSNALGQGADKTLSIKPETGTVYFNTMGTTTLSDTGDIGWTGALGKTWHDRTGHTVLVVKAAWGGTGFEPYSSCYGLWSPDATEEDLAACTSTANHCYADAKTRYNNAVASVQSYLESGYEVGECVYFWCQGENENSRYDAQQYTEAFLNMHERMKTEFGTEGTRLTKVGILPIRKKSNPTSISTSLEITGPRASQVYLSNTRSDVIYASTATENWYSDESIKAWFEAKYPDGSYTNGDMPQCVDDVWSDYVHYNQKAYNEFGIEAANAMLDYIEETNTCTGISILGQSGIKHYENGADIVLPETTVVPLINSPSGTTTATYTLTGNAAEMTEYNEIIPKTTYKNDYSTLTVTYDNGKTMSFRLYSPLVDESVSIAPVKDNKAAIYTLTTDDNYKYTNQYLDEKFKSLGLVGTLGLVSDWIGNEGKLSLEEAQALVNTGRWGVASHTKGHKQSGFTTDSLTDAQLEEEINGGRNILREYFPGEKIVAMYTPGGGTSDRIVNKVKENHVILRRAGGGNNSLPISESSMLNLKSCTVGTTWGTTAETMNGWIDTAISSGQWVCEMWHGIDDDASSWGGNISATYADAHLEYVKEKMDEGKLWVTTLDEAGIYCYQRAKTVLSKLSQTDTELKILIKDELDNDIFDSDLTVNVTLPVGWTSAVVTAGSETLETALANGVLSFNVVHDIGEVIITKTN